MRANQFRKGNSQLCRCNPSTWEAEGGGFPVSVLPNQTVGYEGVLTHPRPQGFGFMWVACDKAEHCGGMVWYSKAPGHIVVTRKKARREIETDLF